MTEYGIIFQSKEERDAFYKWLFECLGVRPEECHRNYLYAAFEEFLEEYKRFQ